MLAAANSSAALDDMAAQAAAILNVPIGLVTFVAADEQFFQGECGLPATLAMLRKMPISYSICQFTVRTPRPLIISDTEIDPLLAGHASVRDMGIRAYLGVPLMLCGQAVGSLSFVDYHVRNWSSDDVAKAEALAEQVVALLERMLEEFRARGA